MYVMNAPPSVTSTIEQLSSSLTAMVDAAEGTTDRRWLGSRRAGSLDTRGSAALLLGRIERQ
jgi:hypothetical protein